MYFWYYLQFFNLTLKYPKAKIENIYFSTRNVYVCMLINVKMLTIVGISTVISRIISRSVELSMEKVI